MTAFVVGQALRSTGFYHCEESNKLTLQMVRDFENVVKDDNRFRLLGRGMVSFP